MLISHDFYMLISHDCDMWHEQQQYNNKNLYFFLDCNLNVSMKYSYQW
jgi:hypothetical protein